jgi:hypothetical protein
VLNVTGEAIDRLLRIIRDAMDKFDGVPAAPYFTALLNAVKIYADHQNIHEARASQHSEVILPGATDYLASLAGTPAPDSPEPEEV